VNPSDPQISPDGKTVAVVLSRANVKENRYDAEIVAIDVASGAQRPLTFERRGVASPRWSPDGTAIAFLANANATADREARRQIWILPAGGGDARRVTDAPRGVQQFAWSPDGSQIAFVTADEPPKSDERPLSFSFTSFNGKPTRITNVVTPGCEWAANGEGVATVKHDGTSWHPKTRNFNTRTMEIAKGWGPATYKRLRSIDTPDGWKSPIRFLRSATGERPSVEQEYALPRPALVGR